LSEGTGSSGAVEVFGKTGEPTGSHTSMDQEIPKFGNEFSTPEFSRISTSHSSDEFLIFFFVRPEKEKSSKSL
jgi:hypothetical protein